jgi:hypothetical protein
VLLANGYDAVIRCDGAATPIVSLVLNNIQGTVLNATNTAVTNDAATAVAVYPTWVTANTGNLPQKTTSASLSFVPSTGVFSATSFSGAGTGLTGTAASLTAGTATNATNATNTAITNDAATAVAVYPTWVTANTGNLPQKTTSASFSFVPSTGVLSITGLVASSSIGLGAAPVTGSSFYNSKNITGATSSRANYTVATVQSDVTLTADGHSTLLGVTNSFFTLQNLRHYVATQNTFGGSATVTNQWGFYSGATLIGATNNWGFYADNTVGAGSGKTSYGFYSAIGSGGLGATWGFYAAGTANNYFAGNTAIGTIRVAGAPSVALDVNGSLALSSPSLVSASAYSVAATDVSLRFTTTACTVTLPAAASFPGRILYLNNVTAILVTSGSANVKPLGSDTAGTAILAATAGKFAMIQSDGSYWITMMAN